MHSFAGMLVVLLLSLLLRGMCLYVRLMGLRLLTHSDSFPENPPLQRTYTAPATARPTHPSHAHLPMRPTSLLCSGRCWPQPPDKGETQARIPAPGFSLICCYSLSNTHVISYLSVTKSSGLELSALLLCLPTLSALALGSIQSPAPRRSMAAFGML